MLVFNLPADSATGHATGSAWTMRDEVSAVTAELGHAMWLQLRALRGDKTVRSAKPLHIPRPNETKRKPTSDPNEIRRFLAATSGRG